MARARSLLVLWPLYFVEGLPFGFQATTLPVLLRDGGASLTAVGLAGALALPWLLKPLWAPWIDRAVQTSGRRRWLLITQLTMLAIAVLGSVVASAPAMLMGVVFLMNLAAATMDIVVDGFAVEVLRERDLGLGNAAQVVGYKLGMLAGGGLLLWLVGSLGPRVMFAAMAVSIAAVLPVSLTLQEPPPRDPAAILTTTQAVATLRRWLTHRYAWWLLAAVASYKLGESMADAMFKPFVLDAGFSKEQIGLWIGTWGMLFSVAGSLSGGLMALRLPLTRALAIAATLRVAPLCGQWWLSTLDLPSSRAIVAITCSEHFFGGALTTVMFALMMASVDKRIGGSHFTVLAAVEVVGKTPSSWLSGVLADQYSYNVVFAIAVVQSALFLALLWPLGRARVAHRSNVIS